jgi:anti-sigma B factor antagonist
MAFTVRARQLNGINVVDCVGRLVFGDEALELRRQAKELLESNPVLVLNLREVNYIDSGGLGVMVGLLTTARAAGGDLKLAGPAARALEVLAITHLDSVFEIYPSVERAAESLRSPAA